MLHGQVYIVSAPAFRGPSYGVMTCVQQTNPIGSCARTNPMHGDTMHVTKITEDQSYGTVHVATPTCAQPQVRALCQV